MSANHKLRVFEGNMHQALKSWHANGGQETLEPQIAEMPFDAVLRREASDPAVIERIQRAHVRWQELQIAANELADDPAATKAQRLAAQREADGWYARHESDFALLATLGEESEISDYDWQQRTMGVKIVFRWILAEGFSPLKIMKRLYAVGRAMHVAPFTELTMEEQGKMFSETKAAVSWRVRLLSGLISFRGMRGRRLPGQKTPASSAAYSGCQKGNTNRKTGAARKRLRQASFLRSLHVPTTKPKS